MNNVVKFQTVEPMRPRDYSGSQLSLIKRTVAADCNNDEFDLFMEVSRRVGLDPFRKQIYAVVYNKGDAEKRKMSIITAIDGFRAVAARNRDYRPDDEEPVVVYGEELKGPDTNPLGIEKAIVRAYKLAPDGKWHPAPGVAHWAEFAPLKEIWAYDQEQNKRAPTGRFEIDKKSNWFRMPHVMIAKCAEAQALRRGWPEDLSGIYAPEEMERAMMDVTPSAEAEAHERDARLRLVNAKGSVPILWHAGEQIELVPAGQLADRAIAFLKASGSLTEVEWWATTNVAGLREFWALSKTDALGLKKAIEERVAELSKE